MPTALHAPPDPSPAAHGIAPLLLDARILCVSGKGGAGKTTVAAALGLVAARAGRRTVVCELGGAGHLARAFGAAPATGGPTVLAERLWSLGVDPQDALREWLRRQPGGAAADAVLHRSRAFAHFVAAAPGARELITVGKIADLVGQAPGSDAASFDLAIVDGPATGHALGMLGAPRAVGEATPVGPVAVQARALRGVLADPRTTRYVGVSLPEDMSVRETLELARGLLAELGRSLDLIVVDGMHPDRLSDADAAVIERAGLRPAWRPLLEAVLAQHRCARRQAEQVRRLREATDAPVIALPFVFGAELGPGEYRRLARVLSRAQAAPALSRSCG